MEIYHKVGIIEFLINIYILLVILDAIISYFPIFQTQVWVRNLKKVADYSCEPIRKILPKGMQYDFSPLVVVVILKLIIILF